MKRGSLRSQNLKVGEFPLVLLPTTLGEEVHALAQILPVPYPGVSCPQMTELLLFPTHLALPFKSQQSANLAKD